MKIPFLKVQSDHLSRNSLVWVLVAQAVSIAPLLFKLPIWVPFVWLLALIWRVQIFRGAIGFPNGLVKFVLGLACVLAILGSYAGVVGVEPMVGFLVCSFVLKLIEMHTAKDALVVLFIGFIAIAAQFLFAQSILTAFYGLLSFIFILTAWQAVVTGQQRAWPQQLKGAASMVLQSLPMLLILFVVMPRLGPLWSVPMPKGHGQTGFSDTLELGDIGQLVKSYDVAFHVEFNGRRPDPDSLYWRGLTLDEFNGREWTASNVWVDNRLRRAADAPPFNLIDYTIIIEPHYQQWLFSLGFPLEFESQQLRIRRNQNSLLQSEKPVAQKAQYRVVSELAQDRLSRANTLVPHNLARYTEFPENFNPRTQALAERWLSEGLSADEIIDAALARYSASFYYTLQPPSLGLNAVDDFLFESQRGFCEHFASSFVLLMRAAHIPARIVVGYQGGTTNPEGFLTVRQADAHAWAEVWLDNRGWVNIDPTAAVAPDRISLGVEGALGDDDRELLQASHWQKRWFNRISQQWEAVGYRWQRWVLNYDNDTKEAFFERWLGGVSVWHVGIAFIGLCGFVLGAVAVVLYWQRRKIYASPEDKLMARVLKTAERNGFLLNSGETLMQFLERVRNINPDYARRLEPVIRDYYAARYQRKAGARQALAQSAGKFS